MIIISVSFDNNSRHISATGMHKSRANLFCTVIPNTCDSSVCDILHVNVTVERTVCGIYTFVKFSNIWFGIKQNVNDGIIIRLCLLNNIYFLYPNDHNTFSVCISLFFTTCFVWYYRLKSGRIEKIRMEKCTEFDASNL
jgi:pectate lyase